MKTPSYVWVKPKRVKPPHPTALTLLETTVELLDEVPIDAVSLAMVLERSLVSQGSLYHHFEDFSDLVEKAVVHRYTRGLRESLVSMAALVDCTDIADFRRQAELLLVASNDQARRRNRLEREPPRIPGRFTLLKLLAALWWQLGGVRQVAQTTRSEFVSS